MACRSVLVRCVRCDQGSSMTGRDEEGWPRFSAMRMDRCADIALTAGRFQSSLHSMIDSRPRCGLAERSFLLWVRMTTHNQWEKNDGPTYLLTCHRKLWADLQNMDSVEPASNFVSRVLSRAIHSSLWRTATFERTSSLDSFSMARGRAGALPAARRLHAPLRP
ncbi:hypothetical protein BD626DRAFT_215211 [Schizophyllum amplum]|uniref:Uncharacterized protein n=1 Tax=Schizophyllum amplum TaxID=97359 RepID=A0A550CK70_9AGAR|nr:hypothetical protein BD626DRAFT_215211 [Auriculariopsis ampla]